MYLYLWVPQLQNFEYGGSSKKDVLSTFCAIGRFWPQNRATNVYKEVARRRCQCTFDHPENIDAL